MVPDRIKNIMEPYVDQIKTFNQGILRMRNLETRFGSKGRYESEYRSSQDGDISIALTEIEKFTTCAAKQGIDLKEALEAIEYEPAISESEASIAWRS